MSPMKQHFYIKTASVIPYMAQAVLTHCIFNAYLLLFIRENFSSFPPLEFWTDTPEFIFCFGWYSEKQGSFVQLFIHQGLSCSLSPSLHNPVLCQLERWSGVLISSVLHPYWTREEIGYLYWKSLNSSAFNTYTMIKHHSLSKYSVL